MGIFMGRECVEKTCNKMSKDDIKWNEMFKNEMILLKDTKG